MRFIGAGLIWMSFIFAGMKVSQRYKRRCVIFSELVSLAESISNDIRYFAKPLSDAVSSVYTDASCESLTFLEDFTNYIYSGTDFPIAWETAVLSSGILLDSKERQKLISFGESLGRSDSEIQFNILNSYRTYFLSCAEKANAKSEKYSLTAMISGILIGGAVFIILI